MHVRTSTPDGVMRPIGPYSHIAKAGPFISISATAGVDPATGELAGADVYTQTRQILEAFRILLATVDSSLRQVLHVTVFLLDIGDFEEMNRAYREGFPDHQPARSVVAVSGLPKKGARLTMNLTAVGESGAN